MRDRQTDRQTDRQIDRASEREKERERGREASVLTFYTIWGSAAGLLNKRPCLAPTLVVTKFTTAGDMT